MKEVGGKFVLQADYLIAAVLLIKSFQTYSLFS